MQFLDLARRTLPTPADLAEPASELRAAVERYTEDRAALLRRYDDAHSPERAARLRAHYAAWREWLLGLDQSPLGPEGRLDAALLALQLDREEALLDLAATRRAEVAPLLPQMECISALHEDRRRHRSIDAAGAAAALASVTAAVRAAAEALPGSGASAIVAARAAGILEDLQETLSAWHRHYQGYHPTFTWWSSEPYQQATAALTDYRAALRLHAGLRDQPDDPVIGDPVGEEALRAALRLERIAYTPEELFALAEREFAWCDSEMTRAAADLGCPDWASALERVKESHVEPGAQPDLVRDLALEAVEFVRERGLVTVPPLAEEVWRLEMMSAEAQRVNPFFLGGERIIVSYPTDAMSHAEKRMSLRGNNPAFSRATVQHELIPGHHLQGFMLARHHPHRAAFGTPFWIEGWTLYWELRLWELGFPRTPAERAGMLFWRSHRAARVLFSLGFHLGRMTPEECVALLVERVGHEPANARAEVRRSFNGDYPPLYQLAYLIGGMQVRALQREAVGGGRFTDCAFHDAFLRGNQMPVEWARARLVGEAPRYPSEPGWRFGEA
jgi:hypothetical protein